jgi:hypothetical protein
VAGIVADGEGVKVGTEVFWATVGLRVAEGEGIKAVGVELTGAQAARAARPVKIRIIFKKGLILNAGNVIGHLNLGQYRYAYREGRAFI